MEDVWGAPGLATALIPPVAPTDPVAGAVPVAPAAPVAAANPANKAGKVPG